MSALRVTGRSLTGGLMVMAIVAGLSLAIRPVAGQAPRAKRIVLIAGRPSHPPGMHEFNAGALLLQKALSGVPGVTTEVYSGGWPSKMVDGKPVDDSAALDGADAVLIYADGGGGNPAIRADHLQVLEALAAKGVGLGFAHYGVEVPVGDGANALNRWIGGYYEDRYSVNPMWTPAFEKFPNHPVARGVKPFGTLDEWYFNMRWTPDEAMKKRITPILTALPSDDVRDGPYVSPRGPYDHIVAAKGQVETMMWVLERPNGGRGFGFTGGHTHTHWGDPNQRKVVLNALLWIAKVEVPANGVQDSITDADLAANLDKKGR
jgi:hypothetical protein